MQRPPALALAKILLLTHVSAEWRSPGGHIDDNAVLSPHGMALSVLPPHMMADEHRFLKINAGGSFQEAVHDWCGVATLYECNQTEARRRGRPCEWMEWAMGACYEDLLGLLCDWHVDTLDIEALLPFIAQFGHGSQVGAHGHGKPLQYIQIGAHTADDYCHGKPRVKVRHGHWHEHADEDFFFSEETVRPFGLIVEPVPSTFAKIHKAAGHAYNNTWYANSGNVYENVAVCNQTATVKLYTVRSTVHPGSGVDSHTGRYLHELVTQVSSLDRSFFTAQFEKLVGGRANLSEYMEVIDVPCLSVGDLLSKHSQFANADVVIIDAEGADLSILTQFDLSNTSIVIFEHVHLLEEERKAAEQFLQRFGLNDSFTQYGDTIAVRRSTLTAWCRAGTGISGVAPTTWVSQGLAQRPVNGWQSKRSDMPPVLHADCHSSSPCKQLE